MGCGACGSAACGIASSPIWLAGAAWPEQRYVVDERSGSVDFSVTHFGLFTSHGWFRRFSAVLRIDPRHPGAAQVTFDIDARSIEVPWRHWIARLLSSDYFAADDYPDLRFTSTGIALDSPRHYLVYGLMEIRGVTQPVTLKAELKGYEFNRAKNITDLVVSGRLKRSEFGMMADPIAISDRHRTIRTRLQLDRGADMG